jgi:division protein CdvB (Snf7/Vps24/ESCRT-III family)
VSTIILRLLQVFGFGQGQEPDISRRIDHVIVRLELLEDKVAELRYKFERRSRELFEKVIQLLYKGERNRAAIYAGEVSQVRNILKAVVAAENLIIMTKERLKTVRDARELGTTLMVFGAALEEVKGHVTSIYPNLSMVFDEISRSVRNMIVETSVGAISEVDPTVISSGAIEVLKEAMKKAEEKIMREFPEPPVAAQIQVQPVAAPAGTAGSRARRGTGTYEKRLEDLVLEYIRSHGGYLDVNDFTSRYGVTKSQLLQALHRLAERGLIEITS